MNPIPDRSTSSVDSQTPRRFAVRVALAGLAAGLLAAHSAHGQAITVPNYSFESPVVPPLNEDPEDVIPGAPDSWTQTAVGLANYTYQAVGVFGNIQGGPYINNLDGNQAAYIINYQGNGLYQNLGTNYTVGTAYTMSVGLIGGDGVTASDNMDLIFYYQNGPTMVTLADVPINGAASTDLSEIEYFSASMGAVQAGDPEVGQPIGVEIAVSSGNEGGFWDVDNVIVAPEPATFGLLAFGLGALAMRRRRVAY